MTTVRRSFTLDDERDAALLAWLDAQPNASEAIRGALRATFKEHTGATLGDVLHAIERLGDRLDGLHVTTATPDQEEEDPELVAALDALGV